MIPSRKDSGLTFLEVVVLITAVAVICLLAGIIHAG